MCTVTFIPQKNNTFILTSNRDESAARSPQNISSIEQEGVGLIFPRDTGAGGTWVATSTRNQVVCLLNGAFDKHQHRPPYSKSRGIMVMEFFKYPNANAFFEDYNWDGMEPFTFVIYDNGDLYELRWDEREKYVTKLDASNYYLWSSATLYQKNIRAERQQWFQNWLKNRTDFSLEAIQHFHANGGKGDTWNGFIMNRLNLVQTVSITNIVKEREKTKMIYNDLINEKVKEAALQLEKRLVI